MANQQVDVTPASAPSLGLHCHAPSGASAAGFNNPSDFAAVSPKAAATGVSTKIITASGTVVRFANPS